MPPLPSMRLEVLADLVKQLRFAPRAAVVRQLDRAEALVREIDPQREYPADWIVYRVTGHRTESRGAGLVAGSALLADMAGLVARLSVLAGQSWEELAPGRFLEIDDVCARWGVSRKTVDRQRPLGLVWRRVRGSGGRLRSVIAAEVVEWFERARAPELERARSFTRMGAEAEEALVREAAALRAEEGLSLSAAARRLAEVHGRSHEGVRQVLRRRGARDGVFEERGPASARERRLMVRAAGMGVPIADVARRLGRPAPAVRRVVRDERAARLRRVTIAGARDASFEETGAAARWLGAAEAREGLGSPGVTELRAWIESARGASPRPAAFERACGTAACYLRWRAAAALERLPTESVRAEPLDAIETDLLWAARLLAELVRPSLSIVVRAIESRVEGAVESVPAGALVVLVRAGIGGACAGAAAFDPMRGGRVAAPIGLAVDRAIAGALRAVGEVERARAGRAARRLGPGSVLADWTRSVAPWQAVVEGPWWVRRGLAGAGESARALVGERFGLLGSPPMRLAALASSRGVSRARIAVLLEGAMAEVCAAGTPGR